MALKDRIRSNFDALYLHGATVVEAKGLNDQDLHALLLMLHPSASDNPFRRNARIRNWLTKLPIAFICQVQPPAPRLRHDPKVEREALP